MINIDNIVLSCQLNVLDAYYSPRTHAPAWVSSCHIKSKSEHTVNLIMDFPILSKPYIFNYNIVDALNIEIDINAVNNGLATFVVMEGSEIRKFLADKSMGSVSMNQLAYMYGIPESNNHTLTGEIIFKYERNYTVIERIKIGIPIEFLNSWINRNNKYSHSQDLRIKIV